MPPCGGVGAYHQNESSSFLRPSIERQLRSLEFFVFHESMSSSFFIAPYHYRSGTLSCARVGFTWVNAAPASVINCRRARGAVINSERQNCPPTLLTSVSFYSMNCLISSTCANTRVKYQCGCSSDSRCLISCRNLRVSFIVGGSCRRRIALRGVISGHLIAYQIASETPF